jgi:two-component system cell cycle sensor histidine kinase PleC
MVTQLNSNSYKFGDGRDNDQRFQLQGGGHHLLAEESEIIPMSTPNPLEQAMHVGTLDAPGDPGSGFSKQSRESILLLDINLRVIFANQSFYNTFKVGEKDTLGRSLPDFGNGQWNIPRLLVLLRDVLPEKRVIENYVIEHEFMNIGPRRMSLNVSPLRFLEKKAAIIAAAAGGEEEELILLAIKDITERGEIDNLPEKIRKDLEIAKLSQSEAYEYAESIINTVRDPLLVLDQDLKVVTVSRSFCEVFKVSAKETVGQLIYVLGNSQWNIPSLRQLLEAILPQKASFDGYEVEFDFPTIGRRIMLLNARQVQRVLGKERVILLAIEDITERKKAWEELKDTQEKLLRLDKLAALGKLAGIVAHELRNPLGALRNSLYFLRMKLDPALQDEKINRHLEMMDQEIRISEKIISDALFFTRVKQPILTQNNLNEILKAALTKVILDPHIKVETELAELPLLPSDDAQLVQVFINIILNAAESMPKGGKLSISSSINQDGAFINVRIKDTGEGISKENLLRLFEPLFSTKLKGTGLGMVVCKSIIENHKGYIRVESEENKGTLVTVKLPIEQI